MWRSSTVEMPNSLWTRCSTLKGSSWHLHHLLCDWVWILIIRLILNKNCCIVLLVFFQTEIGTVFSWSINKKGDTCAKKAEPVQDTRPRIIWNSLEQCFGTNLLTVIEVFLKCTQRQRSGREQQMMLLPHLRADPCRAQWRPDQRRCVLLEEEHALLRYLIHISYGTFWGESCIRSNLQMRCSVFCCSAGHTETEGEALSFQSAQNRQAALQLQDALIKSFCFTETD